MRESEVEKYLVAQFTKLGAEVRKLKFIGRRGAPDRLIMFKGLTFFVEVKAPGKKLQIHQANEIERMTKVRQTVYVVDSLKSVDALIQQHKELVG